jgi:rhodanese-related sulfurtransferase
MQFASRFTALLALLCALGATHPATAQGLFQSEVPTIAVEEIIDAEQSGRPLLLVDVRSPEETAVSMIPGAITRRQYERDSKKYTDYRIVPYCTVGARSRKYTRELIARGVDAVNFQGSILAWAEAGQPLVTPDGEPTMKVHTYSERFDVPPPYEAVTD